MALGRDECFILSAEFNTESSLGLTWAAVSIVYKDRGRFVENLLDSLRALIRM